MKTSELDTAALDSFVKEHGMLGWRETSAKLDVGISPTMKDVVAKVVSTGVLDMERVVDPDVRAAESGTSARSRCKC